MVSFEGEQKTRELYGRITKELIALHLSITTMESATSGQIASLLTDTEGASAILKGAYITYSNLAKIKMGVPEDVIVRFGVYSRETAEKMAEAAQKAFEADLAVGVTGTFGNVDPANGDSIPGTMYFAICFRGETYSYVREFPQLPDRLSYKLAAAQEVGKELIKFLE